MYAQKAEDPEYSPEERKRYWWAAKRLRDRLGAENAEEGEPWGYEQLEKGRRVVKENPILFGLSQAVQQLGGPPVAALEAEEANRILQEWLNDEMRKALIDGDHNRYDQLYQVKEQFEEAARAVEIARQRKTDTRAEGPKSIEDLDKEIERAIEELANIRNRLGPKSNRFKDRGKYLKSLYRRRRQLEEAEKQK